MLYISSKYVVMSIKKTKVDLSSRRFDPKKSVERAHRKENKTVEWSLSIDKNKYTWTTRMDRVEIIRKGLPYESIEIISKRADSSIKDVLHALGLKQTTYNLKKKNKDLLNRRDSEVILVLTELLDYGLEVFNNEKEKFQRWLKKPNVSLGGTTPESLFDSLTGIQEVRNSLNRLEYGNLA